MQLNIDPDRFLADLKALREIGKAGTGVKRRALSEDDIRARRWLRERMEQAGLDAVMDPLGTVMGITPGVRRHLLIGSHTDTVPHGGWLDGALGVVIGLEIARAFMEAPGGEIGIAAISFTDEEGRFCPLMGSRLFCGDLSLEEALGHTDEAGLTVAEARAAAGLDDGRLLRLDPDACMAFLEAHIEQGPVLEHQAVDIGVVTEIVGIGRNRVIFRGRADHAGTTPMDMRRDAAAALHAFADGFRRFCGESSNGNWVWNLGAARIEPGAFNVVAERAEILIEYRSSGEDALDRIARTIPDLAAEAAATARVTFDMEAVGRVEPVGMDADIAGTLHVAAEEAGLSAIRMASGAGHDAMQLARHVPTGMIFIPSIAGRSHTPEEDSHEKDIVAGLRTVARAAERLLAEAG